MVVIWENKSETSCVILINLLCVLHISVLHSQQGSMHNSRTLFSLFLIEKSMICHSYKSSLKIPNKRYINDIFFDLMNIARMYPEFPNQYTRKQKYTSKLVHLEENVGINIRYFFLKSLVMSEKISVC